MDIPQDADILDMDADILPVILDMVAQDIQDTVEEVTMEGDITNGL